MAEGKQITPADLGLEGKDRKEGPVLSLRDIRDEAERNAVLAVLGHADGNIAKAASLLGVSRPTLYDLMHRFGLR
jgi:two-component system NtrC family response regulator